MPVARRRRRFSRAQSGVGALPAGGRDVDPASALICVIPTGLGGSLGQQLQVQGAQLAPGAQAGQAQPQPPPGPLPASPAPDPILAQTPLGQGVVKQAIPKVVQPHASAVSARQDFASA
jgi:hypothetical protein